MREIIETPINGTSLKITIETDPTWGEFENVIKTVTSKSNAGGSAGYTFLEEITRAVIIEGLPFPKQDLTAWKNIKMSEMTLLVGKVTAKIPLSTYFDNLGKDNPIMSQLSQG